MNVQNLKDHHQDLINHMISAEYSLNYIQQIRREIRLILEQPDRWNTYDEVIAYYEKQCKNNPKKASGFRTKIRLIKRFDLEGKLPRDPDHPKDWNYFDSAYLHLNPEYQGIIDYYQEHADRDVKKETTIYNECRNTASFLLHLQEADFQSLTYVDQDAVISILTDENGYPSKSKSYIEQILAVFRGASDYNPDCCRVALLIPIIRKRRKNIQYLKPDERAALKTTLRNQDNSIYLRDQAIGCLLYYNGLRCSDISNLKLSDIDWEKEEISVSQQKTGVPFKIPLTATVGNAIYDYITLERRPSNSEYIFLSLKYPFGKMTPGAIGNRTYPLFKKAGIRQDYAARKGGHIFRHNFATSMLENGASRTIISRALGHTSPDSTEVYLSADMVHLKELSLSIEDFPVREGVFTSERV